MGGGGARFKNGKQLHLKCLYSHMNLLFMHPLHAAATGFHAEQCRYEIIKNDSWLLNKCISVVLCSKKGSGFVCRVMGPNLHQ